MIMDLQACAKLITDAGLPAGECRAVAALNHIAGAAALITSLASSARDLNDPHLLESFYIAHSGLERAWLALANTWGSLSQETVEGTPDSCSPFLPLPGWTGGES